MVSRFEWIPICKLCQRLEGDHVLASTSVGANQFLHFFLHLAHLCWCKPIFALSPPGFKTSKLFCQEPSCFLSSYLTFFKATSFFKKLQNLFLSRAILFSIKLFHSLHGNLLFSKSPYFLQSYIIFPCVNPWLYWIGSNFSPQNSKLQLHILIL